ncbi:MAG: hypothetical protein A3C07_01255 [Candidatus Sungbacteria bacterium RIFCSPHIGHO2_02_FULL_47_11]|uniref:Uncharacterized protein n=1 Tax=Candidatus Sungbacteria bacterium RIFCSPHIGHO2_02_FULL_47_11 TaxID=1802270 RepID=A0A1G2KM53_9BACT|nr:MAG: hypothetical protein A3C07_01255 [Candidatus Sungbacteria bacterium RIFCSPHIGHO2_02_FULL_47_11]
MYRIFEKPHTLLLEAALLITPFAAAAQINRPLGTAIFILDVLEVVVTIVFVMAVIVFGWGIVKLIIAAGNPTQIQQAKQFIWWGVIGMAILASIFGIILYLQSFFGVSSIGGVIRPPEVDYSPF